jgi:hypothetical protein
MSGEPVKLVEPYREPSKGDSEPLEPIATPLVEFKKHEKALAAIRVYRQHLAMCVGYEPAFNQLKDQARDYLYTKTVGTQMCYAGSPWRAALAWLEGLSLDDLEAFTDQSGPTKYELALAAEKEKLARERAEEKLARVTTELDVGGWLRKCTFLAKCAGVVFLCSLVLQILFRYWRR